MLASPCRCSSAGVGFKLFGELPAGATATDLVLTVTQILRKKGVVGKFVEFYGDGIAALSLADRATIANMAPSTVPPAACPGGRGDAALHAVHGRARRAGESGRGVLQGTGHVPRPGAAEPSSPTRSNSTWRPSNRAWPARPAARPCAVAGCQEDVADALPNLLVKGKAVPVPVLAIAPRRRRRLVDTKPHEPPPGPTIEEMDGPTHEEVTERAARKLHHGSVVIAAITSCTNTSNPSSWSRPGCSPRRPSPAA